jgi:hypothetical protein
VLFTETEGDISVANSSFESSGTDEEALVKNVAGSWILGSYMRSVEQNAIALVATYVEGAVGIIVILL